MATKRICDRCGAEINPQSSAAYVRFRRACEGAAGIDETELCVSCGMRIREWLKPVNLQALSEKEADKAERAMEGKA